jgi:O-antigen/teichoic acid export membrane protein
MDSVLDVQPIKSARSLRNELSVRFKPGAFLRNVTIVSSGTAISQGISVVTAPLLTRLYSPADFGILGFYLSVVPILTIISTLQYSQAIVLPREERKAKALLGTTIRIATVVVASVLALTLLAMFVGQEKVGLKSIP